MSHFFTYHWTFISVEKNDLRRNKGVSGTGEKALY